MEQPGLGSGVGVVLLLVLAVAAGPDDSPVLVTPDVHLAPAAGERAGGELLDESFIMTAQALYLVLMKRRVCLAWFRGGCHEGVVCWELLAEDLLDTEDEFVGLGPSGVDEGVADLS